VSELHFEYQDLTERELAYLARFLVDLRTFWPILTQRVISWIGEEFDTEGESWAGPWAPLSDAYEEWKSERFPGKGILSMYGDLRRAATSPRREPLPQALTLTIEGYRHRTTGEDIDPAWFQDGTDRMPARPLIGEHLTPRMEAEVREAADVYVGGILRTIR
jgi:hypothetical protein